jgi:hypothetical protein
MRKKFKAVVFSLFLMSICASGQFKTGFDIKAGAFVPFGSFSDFYNIGYGITGGFIFPFNEDFSFTLNSGYIRWSFDNDEFNRRNSSDSYESFDLKAPFRVIPIVLGIRYNAATSGTLRPYLIAEIGFYHYSQTISGSYVWRSQTYNLPDITESAFRTTLGGGLGITYPINDKFSLDLHGKLNILLDAQALSNVNSNGQVRRTLNSYTYITFAAGINYYY